MKKTKKGLFFPADTVQKQLVHEKRFQFIGSDEISESVLKMSGAEGSKRQKLEDFLPVIVNGDEGEVTYQYKRNNREMCRLSKSIGSSSKIPESEIIGLEKAFSVAEKQAKTNRKVNSAARGAFLSLNLPDPECSQDLYRLWGPPWSKKLMVLWGISFPGQNLVPWRVAIEKLKKRSRSNTLQKLIWFGLLPLVFLLLSFGGWKGYTYAKEWKCRKQLESVNKLEIEIQNLSTDVDGNLARASEANSKAVLAECSADNTHDSDELNSLRKRISTIAELNVGEGDDVCLEAKEKAQRMLKHAKKVESRIEKINDYVSDISRVGGEITELLRSCQQMINKFNDDIVPFVKSQPREVAGEFLNPEIKKLRLVIMDIKKIENLISNYRLNSERNIKKLVASKPPILMQDVNERLRRIKKDFEEINNFYSGYGINLLNE